MDPPAPAPSKASPSSARNGSARQKFSLYHADGQEAVQRQLLEPWADAFKNRDRVLDIGCGPGTFLELLNERGVAGVGIDLDPDMVDYCRSRGFEAQVADARTLAGFQSEFGGIHASHVIEHMTGEAALGFLEACGDALKPGGLLVIRTPNWEYEPVRNGGFWLDYSHVRPYPLPVLERMLQDLGLMVVDKGAEPYGMRDLYVVAQRPAQEGTQPVWQAAVDRNARARQAAVLWSSPLLDPSGYADEARNFVLGLDTLGVALKTSPIEWSARRAELTPADREGLERLTAAALGSDYVHVQHIFPVAFQPDHRALATVGRTMFETDRIPQNWVAQCNAMDEIWVPSQFNVQSFAAAGVDPKKLRTLPGAIDAARFSGEVLPLPLDGARGFKFLSIFDWHLRKGWDVLVRAFVEEFSANEDVCLVLKVWSSMGESDQQLTEKLKRYVRETLGRDLRQVPKIVMLGGTLSDQQLLQLYAASDAYVSASRGEGWGRPFLEAMASGLPTIATNWSGNTEFMTSDNSYLLDYTLVDVSPEALAEVPTMVGHRWAEPSLEHLRQLMREVFSDPETARAKGTRARAEVLAKYDRPVVARIIDEHLKRITGQTTTPTPVVWEGSQFVHHSLGHVNREMSLGLIGSQKVDLAVVPYEQHQFDASADPRFAAIQQRIGRSVAPKVHVRHQWPPNFEAPTEGAWVMVQPWEYGGLPADWIAPMRDEVDEIWVYTSWLKESYVRSGIPADKVAVVPLGVDSQRYTPHGSRYPLNTRKSFKFLFLGGTIPRKGVDVLLQAYLAGFSSADDVCLVIKGFGANSIYSGSSVRDLVDRIAAEPGAPEIEYIEQTLTDEEIAQLYRSCDSLVHPYRGEGFGMPIAEAMATALPVIVTNYGACLDFCDADTAYLIPAREVPMTNVEGLPPSSVGYWWAEPDYQVLAGIMRGVAANPEAAGAVGRRARERMLALSWERAAGVALERITHLAGRTPLRFVDQHTFPRAA